MDALIQDLRYAWRQLAQRPGLSVAVATILALGIGANAAMFSVVQAVVLRPLPYPDPERLVRVRGGSSFPELRDLQDASRRIRAFGGYREHFLDATQGPEPERIDSALVTGGLLPLLGARAERGRVLGPEDDREGGPRVVVVSHGFWQTRLGGDPAAVGRALSFGGLDYQLLGVLENGFRLPGGAADVWAPLGVESREEAAARGAHSLVAVGRLQPGVPLAEAQAELDAIARRLGELHPDESRDRRFVLAPLHESMVREARPALLMLSGAVAFVLLIACANVANLLLARAAAREREIAIRACLGASRMRLARQLLAEGVLLALLGGVAGLLLSSWAVDAALGLAPLRLHGLQEVHVDAGVLGFAAALSLLTGVVFSLAPALHAAHPDLQRSLRDGPRASGGAGRQRLRSLLVVSEVSLALVLLFGAGLLLRSLGRLQAVDPGFETRGLLTLNITLPLQRYGDIAKRTAFFEQILEGVRVLPGVEAVGATSELPFGTGSVFHNFVIDGRPPLEPGREPEIYNRSVSPSYFATLGLRLGRGRGFTPDDRAGAPPVAVVNEAAARRHFPGEDPVGRRIAWARADTRRWLTIVGVVADIRGVRLDSEDAPAVYTPLAQEVRFWKSWMNLAVRTSLEPAAQTPAIRRAVAQADQTIPVARVSTMEQLLAASLAERRFTLALLGAFAGLALLLAGLGIHAVIAYLVSQRTHEIGIRVALGASRGDIARLVLRQGLALVAAGVGLGAAGALALRSFVAAWLFGVGPYDPAALAGAAALLVGAALAASYVPARRALRVDPMVALRCE